jgi:hypothetical protein
MVTTLSAGRGWLTDEAAASIVRIDAALGHPMQITEAGRTWAQQNAHYQAYLRYLAGGAYAPIALSPDAPSIHQLGNAIDTDEGQKHVSLLAEHGWIRTVYRAGKLVEPWHFEYSTSRDHHLAAPTGSGATPGDDDMSTQDIYDARDGDGRNMLDLGRQIRDDIAGLAREVADVGGKVWRNPLTDPTTGRELPAKEFQRYAFDLHRSILLEVRALNVAELTKLTDDQLEAYANALDAEIARRR